MTIRLWISRGERNGNRSHLTHSLLFSASHNNSIPQCCLFYLTKHGCVWIGLSRFKCILWLTSLCALQESRGNALTFMQRHTFSNAGTLMQGGFWSLCHTDSDVAFLLHSVPRPCLSVSFFYYPSLYTPPSYPPSVVLVDFFFTLPFSRCQGPWQPE